MLKALKIITQWLQSLLLGNPYISLHLQVKGQGQRIKKVKFQFYVSSAFVSICSYMSDGVFVCFRVLRIR